MESVAYTMIATITLSFLAFPFLNRILKVSGTNFLIKYNLVIIRCHTLIRQYGLFIAAILKVII